VDPDGKDADFAGCADRVADIAFADFFMGTEGRVAGLGTAGFCRPAAVVFLMTVVGKLG